MREALSNISAAGLYISSIGVLLLPKKLAMVSTATTVMLSLISGRVRPVGLAVLGCYAGLLALPSYLENPYARFGVNILGVLLNAAISLHKMPGFSNEHIIQNEVISDGAVPYNLYLNYDKVLAGQITLLAFGLQTDAVLAQMRSTAFPAISLITSATIMAELLGAKMLGYVKPEFKIKPHFKRWAATNLLLVCPAEEALFRMQTQGNLFKQAQPQIALLLSSALFGGAHFQGGLKYVGLAGLAGAGYGLSYQLTGDVRSSMLTHFLVNFVHFLAFTYPALESSVSPQASF